MDLWRSKDFADAKLKTSGQQTGCSHPWWLRSRGGHDSSFKRCMFLMSLNVFVQAVKDEVMPFSSWCLLCGVYSMQAFRMWPFKVYAMVQHVVEKVIFLIVVERHCFGSSDSWQTSVCRYQCYRHFRKNNNSSRLQDVHPRGWVLLPNSKERTGLYRFPMQLVFSFMEDIVLIFLMIPNIEITF